MCCVVHCPALPAWSRTAHKLHIGMMSWGFFTIIKIKKNNARSNNWACLGLFQKCVLKGKCFLVLVPLLATGIKWQQGLLTELYFAPLIHRWTNLPLSESKKPIHFVPNRTYMYMKRACHRNNSSLKDHCVKGFHVALLAWPLTHLLEVFQANMLDVHHSDYFMFSNQAGTQESNYLPGVLRGLPTEPITGVDRL